jgi:hypothetical protein
MVCSSFANKSNQISVVRKLYLEILMIHEQGRMRDRQKTFYAIHAVCL